jgi:CubicO group peptidase (beta-lactamase class C family)
MFASRYRVLLFALLVWPLFSVGEAVDEPAYQPCPLFRAYYPPPTLDKSSEAIKSFSYDITATFDNLVRTGKDDVYGTITPNATSFSVVLFSGVDDGTGDPVFYSYHNTALAARTVLNVTLDSIFPIGTLTQLFTVYAWLVKMGDQRWDDPITRYLPELISIWPLAGELAVPWGDVTIGALASHMAGIGRDCEFFPKLCQCMASY